MIQSYLPVLVWSRRLVSLATAHRTSLDNLPTMPFAFL